MYVKIQQKSKERGKSMLQLERQQKILDYLKENRKATTNELSELLGVSTTTIRTDLNQMDKEKLLTKTHGGAIYKDKTHDMTDLTSRPTCSMTAHWKTRKLKRRLQTRR